MYRTVPAVITAIMFCSLALPAGEVTATDGSRGTYIPGEPVTAESLRLLPIPSSGTDYAFLQSIGDATNLVFGRFKEGERRITLYSDRDSDGMVDLVAHWYLDREVLEYEKDPGKYCSVRAFAGLKKSFFTGELQVDDRQADTFTALARLVKRLGTVTREAGVYRVTSSEPDSAFSERVIFSFADNGPRGADLAFTVEYYRHGQYRVRPAVRHIIYCKNSNDPFVRNLARTLISEAGETSRIGSN